MVLSSVFRAPVYLAYWLCVPGWAGKVAAWARRYGHGGGTDESCKFFRVMSLVKIKPVWDFQPCLTVKNWTVQPQKITRGLKFALETWNFGFRKKSDFTTYVAPKIKVLISCIFVPVCREIRDLSRSSWYNNRTNQIWCLKQEHYSVMRKLDLVSLKLGLQASHLRYGLL